MEEAGAIFLLHVGSLGVISTISTRCHWDCFPVTGVEHQLKHGHLQMYSNNALHSFNCMTKTGIDTVASNGIISIQSPQRISK